MSMRKTRCNSDVANLINLLTSRSAYCLACELLLSMPSKMRLFIIIPCQCFNWSPFFFFSSRRRHTRPLCDWSSDVCSSDLVLHASERWLELYRGHGLRAFPSGDEAVLDPRRFSLEGRAIRKVRQSVGRLERAGFGFRVRSEERRVGKEGCLRWSTGQESERG